MPQVDLEKPTEAVLVQSDQQFKQLYEEHIEYKQRLESIRQKGLLSEKDEIEMKRIKLHKLILKDRMAAMLRQQEA